METKCSSAKAYREVRPHKIRVPLSLAGKAMGVLITQKEMSLLALPAGMRRAVLTDNLRVALPLVVLEAD